MDNLTQTMINLYHSNLSSHAKKNNIDIILPKIEYENIFTPTITEEPSSETNIDDFVYKKPWNRLHVIHKIIKIKEFINQLDINDNELKKHLKTQFTTMVKNKKLTKKTDVDYDSINGKILAIHSLQYKN
jgi:hypothetical protein